MIAKATRKPVIAIITRLIHKNRSSKPSRGRRRVRPRPPPIRHRPPPLARPPTALPPPTARRRGPQWGVTGKMGRGRGWPGRGEGIIHLFFGGGEPITEPMPPTPPPSPPLPPGLRCLGGGGGGVKEGSLFVTPAPFPPPFLPPSPPSPPLCAPCCLPGCRRGWV